MQLQLTACFVSHSSQTLPAETDSQSTCTSVRLLLETAYRKNVEPVKSVVLLKILYNNISLGRSESKDEILWDRVSPMQMPQGIMANSWTLSGRMQAGNEPWTMNGLR